MNAHAQRVVEQAKQICSNNGVRLTPKRKQVLQALLKSEKALSAYELVDYYQAQFQLTIPVVSVYRILEFLQQLHLVHKLNSVNKYTICSHIFDKDKNSKATLFLICHQCHRVKEIHISQEVLNELTSQIDDEEFHIVSPQLELECQCNQCLKTAKSADLAK